jgi:hypothetical protein
MIRPPNIIDRLTASIEAKHPKTQRLAYAMLHGTPPSDPNYIYAPRSVSPLADPRRLPGYDTAVEKLRMASGLEGIVPEVPSDNGRSFYRGSEGRAYIAPDANPISRMHEQYHGAQHQAWGSPTQFSPGQRLGRELGPTLFSRLSNQHLFQGLTGTMYPGGYPTGQSIADARAQLRGVAKGNGEDVSPQWLGSPTGDVLPLNVMALQAAQHGAFGPTALSKKLGFRGDARIPIEQLLDRPEGKSWLRMYLEGNK